MVILQFLIFNSIIYFLGRGLTEVIKFFTKSNTECENLKILGIKFSFFYPIIGLFFLGNFATVINFFTGVDQIWVNVIFLLIILFNFKRTQFIQYSHEGLLSHFIVPGILAISSINIGIHTDAHLYQFNHQAWIRSEKIALGLTNISSRYGYASLYDSISSVFWFNDNAIYFHFLNLVFFAIFFNFLIINLFKGKNNLLFFSSYFVLIFGILDNFGFSGGRNGFIYIEGIGKHDVAFAVIFYVINILLFTSITKNEFKELDFKIAAVLVLFASQLRLLGLFSLLPLIYWYFKIFNFKKSNLYNFIRLTRVPIILGSVWILKNILITGCLVFPVNELFCFEQLSWYKPGTATFEAWVIADFFYGLSTEENLVAWYNHWMSSPFNSAIAKNFIISSSLLAVLRLLFLSNKKRFANKDTLFLIFYISLNFYFWLNSGPGIRFAMGFLILIVGILGLGDFDYRFLKSIFRISENKIIITLAMILCTLLIPRLDKYDPFISNPLYFPTVESPIIETIPNPSGWGVVPKFGNECNINIDCIPYVVNVNLYINSLGYKVFK